ncbi:MAG: flagellar basal body rod protein FlgB [Deltaproteobacteria bacterium]|nr:flagellar basal body rod protein FlgB [Deltaproteobacteria bacterium]
MANDFESLMGLGQKLLGFRVANQSLHASNIANLATSNFKAKEISFKAELDKALKKGEEIFNSMENDNPWKLDVKIKNSNAELNSRGNNVKLDQELSDMTQNAMQYLATVKIISKQLALQRYASTGA